MMIKYLAKIREQTFQREVLRVLENMQTDLYSIHAEVKHIAGLIQDIREPNITIRPQDCTTTCLVLPIYAISQSCGYQGVSQP